MLRAVFIGSDNAFDQALVDWLRGECELAGVVWIDAWAWRRSWAGRWRFLRRRLRRVGAARTADEMLYWLWYNSFAARREQETLCRVVLEPYWRRHGKPSWRGAQTRAGSVNDAATLGFVAGRQPDVVFATCVHEYFGRRLRAIPRHGVLLWHEGITPEYRGLYAPFWAIHNLDFERLGYTLLRMDDRYDAGEVLVQGPATAIEPARHGPGFIGHKAIWDSRAEVASFLRRLEAGSAEPVVRPGAVDGYYSYPGLTDLLRQRRRLRRRGARAAPPKP